MCILVFSSTTIQQIYFITKIPAVWLYEYKIEGLGSYLDGLTVDCFFLASLSFIVGKYKSP